MKNFLLIILGSLTLLASFSLFAEEEVEEVVVVGSQIKGAKITGALPVSVVSGMI